MKLEEILKQQVEIDDLFTHLCKLHERLLVGDNSENDGVSLQTVSLNKVRHDLIICLNDFNTLNDMLISFNGAIKNNIQVLEKARLEINNLKQKKCELLKERDLWILNPNTTGSVSSNTSNNNDNDIIKIKTSYRHKMNQYIDMIGVKNITLFNHPSFTYKDNEKNKGSEEETPLTAKQTIDSLRLLNNCQLEIQNEIVTLKTLLNNLEKDSQLIKNERKQMISLIEYRRNQIENQITNVENNIIKLLNKCGFLFSDNSNSSFSFTSTNSGAISEKLLNFWNSKNNHDIITEKTNIDIVVDHSDEFIDLKIKILTDQLDSRKKNSTNLLADKQLWQECVKALEDLEDSLQGALLNLGKDSNSTLPLPSTLISMITDKVDYLKTSFNNTDNLRLKKLINNEIGNLKMACDELRHNSNNSNKIDPLNDSIKAKTSKIRTLSDNSSDSINYNTYNPIAPLIIGKSPPKIGISNEVANNIFATSINKKKK